MTIWSSLPMISSRSSGCPSHQVATFGIVSLLPKHAGRERGQEREQRRRFDEAGTERVGDHDLAVAHRLHQPRHAEARVRVELERIGKVRRRAGAGSPRCA